MTAGRKRMVIFIEYIQLHVTRSGVKGHAGMIPRQNFGWGANQKRVSIKTKTTPPHHLILTSESLTDVFFISQVTRSDTIQL